MVDLMLQRAYEHGLEPSRKAQRDVAVAQVCAKEVEHEAKDVHSQNRPDRERSFKKKNKKTGCHTKAETVSKSCNCGLEGMIAK